MAEDHGPSLSLPQNKSITHLIQLCPKEYQILDANEYAKTILKDKPNRTQ